MTRRYLPCAASFLVLGCLLTACHADAGPARGQATSAPGVAAPAVAASGAHPGSQSVARKALAEPVPAHPHGMPADWVKHFRKGDAYAAFRKQALANGWKPVESGQCRGQAAGDGACAGIPELDGCSADGYCAMRMTHPGADWAMQVNTYGSTVNWQSNADLRVIGWDFTRGHGK